MPGPFVPARSRFHRSAALLLILLSPLGWILGPAAEAATAPAVRGAEAMVVSPEPHATRAGLEVLRSGGNAVDASVTVAFTLAVTYPLAGNLAGGGFMLYRSEEAAHHALDFRETAPRALCTKDFLDPEGCVIPGSSLTGGLAVGVPGSVAGLAEAHRLWGGKPWAELLSPAIRLAEEGFPVSRWLASTLADSIKKLRADPEARRIFTHDGRPLAEGELLVQPDLAASLRRIAEAGPAGFYDGPTADALIRTVRGRQGVMDAADLEAYRPVLREPLEGEYRGFRIITFPPPSSGGVALLQILGMLERFDLAAEGPGSSRTVHLIAEAARRAFADRARWLGDPDFYQVPLQGLLDPDYLARRSSSIRTRRATRSAKLQAGEPAGAESTETLHFSVVDGAGRAAAVTTTLNARYGTGIVAEGTGILLNNQIDDFALAPGVPNLYGLVGGEANAVRGGKRPLSSMSPTIVEAQKPSARPLLVLGSPGGPTIITSVAQVLINVLDHRLPLQEAVDFPRFHHQWLPDKIRHEPRAFPADVLNALRAKGHELYESGYLGNVNAIGTDPNGVWQGAADPRRSSSAAGY